MFIASMSTLEDKSSLNQVARSGSGFFKQACRVKWLEQSTGLKDDSGLFPSLFFF